MASPNENPLPGQGDASNQPAVLPVSQTSPAPDTGGLTPDAVAAPGVLKSAGKWQAVKNIFGDIYGHRTQTVFNGKGEAQQVPVKEKPGAIFRNILAASLMGGMFAEEAHAKNPFMSAAGGVSTGAGGVIQDQQKQAQLQTEQARKNFETQEQTKATEQNIAASKANVELAQKTAEREDTLMSANVAHLQAATVLLNQQMQGLKISQAKELTDMGEATASVYYAAGVKPKFEGITESNMHDWIKNNPSAANMIPFATGLVPRHDAAGNMIMDKNGQPDYEITYSFFDPNSKAMVTPEFLKSAKDAGLNTGDLKANTLVPASEIVPMMKMYVNRLPFMLKQQLAQNELQKSQLGIEEVKQRIAQTKAEIDRIHAMAGLASREKTAFQSLNDAMDAFGKKADELSRKNGGKPVDPEEVFHGLPYKDQMVLSINNPLKAKRKEILDEDNALLRSTIQGSPEWKAAQDKFKEDQIRLDTTNAWEGYMPERPGAKAEGGGEVKPKEAPAYLAPVPNAAADYLPADKAQQLQGMDSVTARVNFINNQGLDPQSTKALIDLATQANTPGLPFHLTGDSFLDAKAMQASRGLKSTADVEHQLAISSQLTEQQKDRIRQAFGLPTQAEQGEEAKRKLQIRHAVTSMPSVGTP